MYVVQISDKNSLEKRLNYYMNENKRRVPKLSAEERKSDYGSI